GAPACVGGVAGGGGAAPRAGPRARGRGGRRDGGEGGRGAGAAGPREGPRRYHDPDPARRAFGGRVEITLADGSAINDEIAVADAHPAGARPFAREQYIAKFRTLADGIIAPRVQDRFLYTVTRLADPDPPRPAYPPP